MALGIMAAFAAPPEGFVWQFSPDAPTWLQTDSIRDGEAHWYLTQRQGDEGDDPAYYIEIEPTAQSIVEVIAQVADKAWTDKTQLLDAMLPAIRAVAWKE